ncbi:Hypothetical protein I596_2024 [Dokdonella koreensis DS-123]|uniref:Uncharacterized protein n=1 Tax=Dokdonella koreensis DS-123 TaxID=1300342 RepID=A0A160DUT3_9GAMM|nr:Hypothetical protein I596_2024 [Dokdonella koreensis DS-123]
MLRECLRVSPAVVGPAAARRLEAGRPAAPASGRGAVGAVPSPDGVART